MTSLLLLNVEEDPALLEENRNDIVVAGVVAVDCSKKLVGADVVIARNEIVVADAVDEKMFKNIL